MEHDFTLINIHKNKTNFVSNSDFTECYEMDGDFCIYSLFFNEKEQYIIANNKGQKVILIFFKLNGIFYININKYMTIDLKRFLHIEHVLHDIYNNTNTNTNIAIKTVYVGTLILQNCDMNLAHKMLEFIEKWNEKNCDWWYNLKYHMTS